MRSEGLWDAGSPFSPPLNSGRSGSPAMVSALRGVIRLSLCVLWPVRLATVIGFIPRSKRRGQTSCRRSWKRTSIRKPGSGSPPPARPPSRRPPELAPPPVRRPKSRNQEPCSRPSSLRPIRERFKDPDSLPREGDYATLSVFCVGQSHRPFREIDIRPSHFGDLASAHGRFQRKPEKVLENGRPRGADDGLRLLERETAVAGIPDLGKGPGSELGSELHRPVLGSPGEKRTDEGGFEADGDGPNTLSPLKGLQAPVEREEGIQGAKRKEISPFPWLIPESSCQAPFFCWHTSLLLGHVPP